MSKVLGHTGGDLTVSVPDAKVLFTGDMLWRKVAPNLIDGSVQEWSAAVADFVSAPNAGEKRFVPGHGDVADAKDVSEFRAYLLGSTSARGAGGPQGRCVSAGSRAEDAGKLSGLDDQRPVDRRRSPLHERRAGGDEAWFHSRTESFGQHI